MKEDISLDLIKLISNSTSVEDALLALDNMFEMARYSRDEMGAQHQQAAQMALEKMIQEIANLSAIPNR